MPVSFTVLIRAGGYEALRLAALAGHARPPDGTGSWSGSALKKSTEPPFPGRESLSLRELAHSPAGLFGVPRHHADSIGEKPDSVGERVEDVPLHPEVAAGFLDDRVSCLVHGFEDGC
jgi:hypothetical protein